jgi:hypothetical protein
VSGWVEWGCTEMTAKGTWLCEQVEWKGDGTAGGLLARLSAAVFPASSQPNRNTARNREINISQVHEF